MSIDRTRDTRAARKAGLPKTTGSLAPTPGRCRGKLRYTGTSLENPTRYCDKWPLRGKTRCELHAGHQEKGLSDPANATPRAVVANFERWLHDDRRHSLEREIAWARSYHDDVQSRSMEDGAVVSRALVEAVDRVEETAHRVRQLNKSSHPEARRVASQQFSEALTALFAARAPAAIEMTVREELREYWASIGNLSDKENKHLERLHNMITNQAALAIRVAEHTAVMRGVELYVTDPETRRAIRRYIAAEFERLAGRRDHTMVAAGGGPSIDTGASQEAADAGGTPRLLPADVGHQLPDDGGVPRP